MSKLVATTPEGLKRQLADVERIANVAIQEIWIGPHQGNRRWATLFQLALVVCGFLVTVAAGGQLKGDKEHTATWAWISLVSAGLLTAVSAMQAWYSNQKLVAHHEVAVGDMYRLLDDVRFYKEGHPDEIYEAEVVVGFHERYKQIYNNLNQKNLEINTARASSGINKSA